MINSRFYSRFWQVPTFGNGVICRFSDNTSEMKRLAARDFEDMLQVLFSEYLSLNLSCWQFSSLVCHSRLRGIISHRSRCCCAIAVVSIRAVACPCEAQASLGVHGQVSWRNIQAAVAKVTEIPRCHLCCIQYSGIAQRESSLPTKGCKTWWNKPYSPRIKWSEDQDFNLSTYKFHSMGDYATTIKLFGTTDSFTTQIVRIVCIHSLYLKLSLFRENLLTERLRHFIHWRAR